MTAPSERRPNLFALTIAIGLFAANGAANDPVVLWDETQPMLKAAETPTLESVRFSRIKQREPNVDGFNWLHGVAIVRHNGTLFTSWGHNQGKENTLTEIAQGRRSRDDARTWGPVELISAGSKKHGVSHGSFLSHDGALWAFCGRFTGFRQNTATEAFVLDETANRWESRGMVAGDGFWPMAEPVEMNDGNWIMAGIPIDARYKPGSGGQLLAFVPSLDLVIARQTGGSGQWDYEGFLCRACDAVLPGQ